MKKRFTALFLALAMMFSLSACSPNFKAYMDKSEEVNNWPGSEGKGTAEMTFSIKDSETNQNVDFKMPLTVKTKSEGKDKAEVELVYDFTGLKDAVAKDEPEAIKDFPFNDKLEIKMFVDMSDPNNARIIMDKGYFKAMTAGEKNEFLDGIKEDYIALPTGVDSIMGSKAIEYLSSAEFESDLMNLAETALKDFEPKNDIKVDGNKFTYEADINQLTDDGIDALAAITKNWDAVKPILTNLLNKMGQEVKAEDLEMDLNELNKEEASKQAAEIKEQLKGSNIKFETVFDKDKIVQNAVCNLNVGEEFKVNVKMDTETVRNDKIKVNMPTSVKQLTQEEYMNLIMPNQEPLILVTINGEPVEFPDQQPVIVNDRTLVPFRALLEKMGATDIVWDDVNRTVRAKHGDKAIALEIDNTVAIVGNNRVDLDVPAQIIGDRTMVPLRFISENFGYNVKFDNSQPYLYTIEVNNMSEEEIQKKQDAMVEESEKETETEAKEASAIGIIGGADVPTAIFTK